MNEYSCLVAEINNLFESYHELTNDQLRNEVAVIEKEVNSSSAEQAKLLDANMVKAFALLKETQRRFALGDVVVTANAKDKEWAETYDFVDVEGDIAIYHNKWTVRNSSYEWKMIPFDVQLLAGIYLHKGYAAEMATGEGKTLVATLPVFLNALTHAGVHIMTANDYLSMRDYEQMRPIYMFHGLSVGCIEENKRGTDVHKSAYDKDITFGASSTFIFDYLFDHMALRPEDCNQKRPYNYAIIDEIDSILIDEAQTPHFIGGGHFYNEEEAYKSNKNVIVELLADTSLYVYDTNKHSACFTNEGKEWLKEKLGEASLFKYEKTYEIESFDNLHKGEQEKWKELLYRQNILCQLLRAYTAYQKDIDYIVESNKVVIIDENTGRPKPSNRWEYGLHTAVEVKENVKVEDDFDGLGVISTKNFYRLYNKISGMSGTIMQVSDELKNVYGLKTAAIPTNKPVIREDLPLRVFKTKDSKNKAILDLICKVHSENRPILIGCSTILENEELCQMLEDAGLPFKQLNAKSLAKEAYIISQAGEVGAITVSTSIAGRGTDIKLSEEAKQSGGLFVIGASMFDSLRIDRQLKGRAGRQGDPGNSQFFTSIEDNIAKNLTEEGKRVLTDKESDEITSEHVVTLFGKAQLRNDEMSEQRRKRVSYKDDTINPYRNKYYSERNKVLFDTDFAVILAKRILASSTINFKSITEHIHVLYLQVHSLISQIVANESSDDGISFVYFWGHRIGQVKTNRKDFDIPFSDDRHLFVLTLNKQKALSSEEYFQEEYIRQNLLLVYDKCWTRFVNHLMNDLDDHEIELLPKQYEEMYHEVEHIIVSRLLNASIPVGQRQTDDNKNHIEHPADKIFNQPQTDDFCPCGSGKKYCECHGNIRNNRKKVRR